MHYQPGSHADDDVLEEYSLGSLPDAETEAFEEHLLVCPECQDRLAETDRFVHGMRSASAQLRDTPQLLQVERSGAPKRRLLRPGPILAAVCAVLFAAVAIVRLSVPGSAGALAVALEAHRSAVPRTAPAGRPIALRLDASDLPPLPSYNVQIVNAAGGAVFQAESPRESGQIVVPGARRFPEGRYWVRVYDRSHTLLREYGLAIAP